MKWNLDPAHTDIQFKIRHMGISTVTGQFLDVNGAIHTENEDWSTADASVKIVVDSISTRNEYRDNHLKSDDFFNAEAHPHITFESTSVESKGGNNYALHGEMTIRDNKLPVTLDMEHTGTIDNGDGTKRAAFSLKGEISRKEFGLKWNDLLAGGNAVVSDKVRIEGDAQYVSEKA